MWRGVYILCVCVSSQKSQTCALDYKSSVSRRYLSVEIPVRQNSILCTSDAILLEYARVLQSTEYEFVLDYEICVCVSVYVAFCSTTQLN